MSRQPGRLRRTWKQALGGGLVAALLVADMVMNGLLGGSFDETISSRAGRMARQGSYLAKTVCFVLDTIDPQHCADAAANKGG